MTAPSVVLSVVFFFAAFLPSVVLVRIAFSLVSIFIANHASCSRSSSSSLKARQDVGLVVAATDWKSALPAMPVVSRSLQRIRDARTHSHHPNLPREREGSDRRAAQKLL